MPRGRPRKNKSDVLLQSAELLGWALGGLEREIAETRTRLASLTAQASTVRARIGGKSAQGAGEPAAAPAGRRRRRRRMSAEARRKISERMKRTWAERRRAKAKG